MTGAPRWPPSFTAERIVSFAQNAEDVRLWRVFGTVEGGFYVDIGAALPDVDSVTRLFYEHGWSGINVEPSPSFDTLSAARPRDINLRVAVGESDDPVPFFLTYPYLGMSALDPSTHDALPEAVERIEEITVPQLRLDSILKEHARDRTIHFLKVDVEGAELQVLASSDWSSFRPIVVVVEAIEPWSTSGSHVKWEAVLTNAGYRFAAFDGINRFYVASGHTDLVPALAYPISALDKFVTAPTYNTEIALAQAEEDLRQLRQSVEQARMKLGGARSLPLRRSRAPSPSGILSTAATYARDVRKHLSDRSAT